MELKDASDEGKLVRAVESNMPPFDFRDRSRVRREDLRVAPANDVGVSLVAFCEETEKSGSVDFDEVVKVGILLHENRGNCDAIAIDWLAASPSPLRLDIVGALLDGLWLPNPKLAPPRPGLVSRLAETRPTGRTSPDADYSFVLAMSRILENSEASAEARELAMAQIEEAAVRGTGNSVLDASLLSLRTRLRENRPPRSFPAVLAGLFRAYVCTGDTRAKYIVEARDNQREIAHISELKADATNRILTVDYRKCDLELSNILVVDAISESLLCGLLEHKYRNDVSKVEYVDSEAKFKATLHYPA